MSNLVSRYVYQVTLHIYDSEDDRLWKFITLANDMGEALAIANQHIEESILDCEIRVEKIVELEVAGIMRREG